MASSRYRDVAEYYYNIRQGFLSRGRRAAIDHNSYHILSKVYVYIHILLSGEWRQKSVLWSSGSRVCLLACAALAKSFLNARITLEDGERLTRCEVNGASRDNVTTSGANARRFLASASAAQLFASWTDDDERRGVYCSYIGSSRAVSLIVSSTTWFKLTSLNTIRIYYCTQGSSF